MGIYTITATYKVKATGEDRVLTGPAQTSQRVACKYARDLALPGVIAVVEFSAPRTRVKTK